MDPGMKLSSRYNHNALHRRAVLILVILAALSGCATGRGRTAPVSVSAGPFADILGSYPPTTEPLHIKELPRSSTGAQRLVASAADVYIIVHPGYGVFFQNLTKENHAASKYLLLNKQFENEAAFISSKAAAGATIILVLPGNFETESIAPSSFISYLNKTAAGRSVYYMTSKTSSSGDIATDDMVKLFEFLKSVKAERIMVGGGYVGRCQGEFYNELTSYRSVERTYIVPEISTISPVDISAQEAAEAFEAMQFQNFTLVTRFIGKKAKNAKPNILSIPPPSEN
jgi:hypothetical protein